ncbi:PSTK kinase, partial [Nothocercus julius]|nr:PSTK kinase [Nothocercus julius]
EALAMEARAACGRRRVGLCVLCGLPAAGKSSLARGLRLLLPRRRRWDCALLAYDELIPPEAFAPGLVPLPSRWKSHRQEVLRCLEHFLQALTSGGPLSAPAGCSEAAWERFIACCRGQGLLSSPAPEAGDCHYLANAAASRPLYFILDDNFYYQSMRYEVYQLARKYSLSFCQIFLECPLEQCLQRNRLRSDPLPDETISQMARKIEMPDLDNNAWEKNSLILKSSECALEYNLQIIDLLANVLENPVKQNEENTEQKEVDRAICSASTVHQADKTCRRIISQAMKDAKDKNVHPSEMKSLAEELNKLKAEFLEDLRQGSHLKSQSSDPVTSVTSSFQYEATTIVNKYILR